MDGARWEGSESGGPWRASDWAPQRDKNRTGAAYGAPGRACCAASPLSPLLVCLIFFQHHQQARREHVQIKSCVLCVCRTFVFLVVANAASLSPEQGRPYGLVGLRPLPFVLSIAASASLQPQVRSGKKARRELLGARMERACVLLCPDLAAPDGAGLTLRARVFIVI